VSTSRNELDATMRKKTTATATAHATCATTRRPRRRLVSNAATIGNGQTVLLLLLCGGFLLANTARSIITAGRKSFFGRLFLLLLASSLLLLLLLASSSLILSTRTASRHHSCRSRENALAVPDVVRSIRLDSRLAHALLTRFRLVIESSARLPQLGCAARRRRGGDRRARGGRRRRGWRCFEDTLAVPDVVRSIRLDSRLAHALLTRLRRVVESSTRLPQLGCAARRRRGSGRRARGSG